MDNLCDLSVQNVVKTFDCRRQQHRKKKSRQLISSGSENVPYASETRNQWKANVEMSAVNS
jgi:hypothetical protein